MSKRVADMVMQILDKLNPSPCPNAAQNGCRNVDWREWEYTETGTEYDSAGNPVPVPVRARGTECLNCQRLQQAEQKGRANLLDAVDKAETFVSDDFCELMEHNAATSPEKMTPNERAMQEKLSIVYRVLHSANREHSCYESHEDWRKEAAALAPSSSGEARDK
jgi:hypothetical protein